MVSVKEDVARRQKVKNEFLANAAYLYADLSFYFGARVFRIQNFTKDNFVFIAYN